MLKRIAQIICDRCGATEDLGEPRSKHGKRQQGEPPGWARLTVTTKVSADKPAKVTLVKDICPTCEKSIARWGNLTD